MNELAGAFSRVYFASCYTSLLPYIVPRPTVVVYSIHGNTAYAGRSETLRCEAILLGGVTVNDIRVNFTWMKNNSIIYAVINRVKVLQPMVNGTELQSELVFSSLSSSLDNGTYTCVVNLIPQDLMFVMGAIGSNAMELLVASKLVKGSDSLLQLLHIYLSFPTLAKCIPLLHYHYTLKLQVKSSCPISIFKVLGILWGSELPKTKDGR